MVKQESTYCYEVSRNLFLVLYRKEVRFGTLEVMRDAADAEWDC